MEHKNILNLGQKLEITYMIIYDNIMRSIYIYIYAIARRPQDLRFRGSWGMGRTKHCNAQKKPKFPTLKLTKHCNAQKIQKFQNSGIYGQAGGKFFKKVWNFLSIAVFRELLGCEKLIFWGITVFRGLNITKHCNAQKKATFHSFKAHKT